MKTPNRLQRSLIGQYLYFFITIAIIAALSLFILNAQIMNYFLDSSGQTKVDETQKDDSPAARKEIYSDQQERVFYKMALQTMLLFLVLFAITVYVFGRRTAARLTTPLSSIADGIRNIAQGQYRKRLNYKASYELAQIQDDFNDMAERLERMEREKQELEESKQRMLIDISHDLKTPLTTIRAISKRWRRDSSIRKREEARRCG